MKTPPLLILTLIGKEFVRLLNVQDMAARGLSEREITEAMSFSKDWLTDKYRITAVKSGMQAITYIANHTPDLILLDYEMPVISGAKVLEMIRSEVATADIPVMFLTSKNDKESVMQVLSLKPEKYLLKTMPPEEWLSNIDDFFQKG